VANCPDPSPSRSCASRRGRRSLASETNILKRGGSWKLELRRRGRQAGETGQVFAVSERSELQRRSWERRHLAGHGAKPRLRSFSPNRLSAMRSSGSPPCGDGLARCRRSQRRLRRLPREYLPSLRSFATRETIIGRIRRARGPCRPSTELGRAASTDGDGGCAALIHPMGSRDGLPIFGNRLGTSCMPNSVRAARPYGAQLITRSSL
jgi:hypothetical protein